MYKTNLTGQRYGRLIVIDYAGKRGNYNMWKCKCDCGKETLVDTGHLKNGHTSSCGCLRIERLREKTFNDLTGQRFGKLLVISLFNREHEAVWKCLCDCGQTSIVRSCALITGNTKSCGCGSREALAKGRYKHGKSNTNEMRAFWARRRRERKQEQDNNWTPEMEELLRNTFTSCVVCGSRDRLAVDHVYPLTMGYGLIPGNAVILCKSCNSKKHNRLPEKLDKMVLNKILVAASYFKNIWEMYAATIMRPG